MSTKEDIFSVGPSQPEMIGLPTGSRFVDFCERVENRNSRRAGGLRFESSICLPRCSLSMIWLTFVCVVFTIGASRGL